MKGFLSTRDSKLVMTPSSQIGPTGTGVAVDGGAAAQTADVVGKTSLRRKNVSFSYFGRDAI